MRVNRNKFLNKKETKTLVLICKFSVGFLISIFLLSCGTSDRKDKALESDAKEFLKSIRKYIIVAGTLNPTSDSKSSPNNEINVKVLQATGKSFAADAYGEVNPNAIFKDGFKEALEKLGNKRAKEVNPLDLGLISPAAGETASDRQRWLKTAGIDAVIEVNYSNLVLDYNTRVPDLGILNIFYTFFLLDLWWIDMAGIWSLEGDVSITVTKVSNGNKYSGNSVYLKTSTGKFFVSRIGNDAFTTSLSEITKSAIVNMIQSGSSL